MHAQEQATNQTGGVVSDEFAMQATAGTQWCLQNFLMNYTDLVTSSISSCSSSLNLLLELSCIVEHTVCPEENQRSVSWVSFL